MSEQQNQDDIGGVSGLGDSDASRAGGQQGGFGIGQEHPQDSQAGSQHGGNETGNRQQQQFESQGAGQQGGGSEPFADQITAHYEVIDDNGDHIGTVDHVDGDRIKLSRSDSRDDEHHYVLLSQVAGIEGNRVRLRERGDNDFGQEAGG